MALDPEELKRQRLLRQQQRQAQNRRTVVKLVIAGIVLVLVLVLIASLAGSQPSSTPEPSTEQTNASEQTNSTEQAGTEQQTGQTVIHLAAAGDLNISEATVSSGGETLDYTRTFLDVGHLLAQADIATVNLEGNLFGPPYGTDRSAPANMMQALQRIGVDLVQLANSYSIYKGMDGLSKTIAGVRGAGMNTVGAWATADQAKAAKGYTIQNVKGVRIAFVAFTKGMDGMALPPGNDGCVNLLYEDYSTDYQKVDTDGITRILKAAAKEAPDLTVALLHWGSEYNDTISESQKAICQLMQDNGVDAIIGTHSHYVQKMDYNPDTGSFVAYCLGDFLGDAQRPGSEYSVILDLEITKDNTTGVTKITDYTYTPIFICAEKEKPLRVLRIAEALSAYESGYLDKVSPETYEAMKYAQTRIEARIHPKEASQ